MSILVYSSRRVPLYLDHLSHPNPVTTVRDRTVLRARSRSKFSHVKSQGDSFTPVQRTGRFSAGSSNIQTSCHAMNILWDSSVFNKKCYENVLKLKPCQFAPQGKFSDLYSSDKGQSKR